MEPIVDRTVPIGAIVTRGRDWTHGDEDKDGIKTPYEEHIANLNKILTNLPEICNAENPFNRYIQEHEIRNKVNNLNQNKHGEIIVSRITPTITEGQRKSGNPVCCRGKETRLGLRHSSNAKIVSCEADC